MKMNRKLLLGALLTAFYGCGPAATVQAPSSVFGSVTGRVTDAKNGSPLQNVEIKAIQVTDEGVKELVTKTNADGAYALQKLPAGSTYRIRYAIDAYVARFFDITVADSAGEYPQGNVIAEANVPMAPGSGKIIGKVITAGGKGAAKAKVSVDQRVFNYDLVLETETAADGTFEFAGLPATPTGVQVRVTVWPIDENGDGVPDYNYQQTDFTAFPDVTTRADIDMRNTAQGLTLVVSDMDDGIHAATGTLNMTFNRALDLSRTTVNLTYVDTGSTIATGNKLEEDGRKLVITPSGASLTPGKSYRLEVTPRALNGATNYYSRSFQVLGGASAAPLPAVTNLVVTPNVVNYNTRTFTLTWSAITAAASYRIYARDTRNNQAYVWISSLGATPSPSRSLSLSTTLFDYYPGDGVTTPFAFGVKVDFAVVGVDAAGNFADPATATPVRLADTTVPSVNSTSLTLTGTANSANANNSAGVEPKKVDLNVNFSEYIPLESAPTISLPPGLTATWELNPDMLRGRFIISIPVGQNASSGSYSITAAKDGSGNTMTQHDGSLP
jgi:5-hydroxyisourate hydrolase-like protein (transthyretin family)